MTVFGYFFILGIIGILICSVCKGNYSKCDRFEPESGETLRNNARITRIQTDRFSRQKMKTDVSFDDGFKFSGFDTDVSFESTLIKTVTILTVDGFIKKTIAIRAIEQHMRLLPEYSLYGGISISEKSYSESAMRDDVFFLRYHFEHKVIPALIKESLTNAVMGIHFQNYLYDVFNNLCINNNVNNPYNVSQYSLMGSYCGDDYYVIKLIHPYPERTGLCYISYLTYNEDSRVQAYYQVERNDETGVPLVSYINLYDPYLTRYEYGDYTYFDENDLIRMIIKKLQAPGYVHKSNNLADSARLEMASRQNSNSIDWICSRCGTPNSEHIFVCKCGMKRSENQ